MNIRNNNELKTELKKLSLCKFKERKFNTIKYFSYFFKKLQYHANYVYFIRVINIFSSQHNVNIKSYMSV